MQVRPRVHRPRAVASDFTTAVTDRLSGRDFFAGFHREFREMAINRGVAPAVADEDIAVSRCAAVTDKEHNAMRSGSHSGVRRHREIETQMRHTEVLLVTRNAESCGDAADHRPQKPE